MLVVNDEILRRRLAVSSGNKLELDLLPFAQTLQSGTLHRGDMHERVIRPVVRLDESITLRRVEPLHSSSSHRYSFHYIVITEQNDRSARLVRDEVDLLSTQQSCHRPNAIKIKHDRSTPNLSKLIEYARLCRLMSVKKRDNLSISPWIRRFTPLIPPECEVLDLAAGRGRHSLCFLERGCNVTAVDRDIEALETLSANVAEGTDRLEIIQADLEDGSPFPLTDRRFDAVVVVNYLWRPLFPRILDALDRHGLLLYETFATGQEALGRPSNPDFLLKPGELLDLIAGRLNVVAYEHGRVEGASGPAIKQRIAATGKAEAVSLTPF